MMLLSVSITPFEVSDLPEVLEIEKIVDPSPWVEPSFRNEIETNKLARYFAARCENIATSALTRGRIVGYGGYWLVIDEAHITKITTHPDFRRKKIGEQLLMHILHDAAKRGATRATLELRVSNEPALKLYEKFGFADAGIRKNYYLDNLEDARIMWRENLNKFSGGSI